MLAKLNVVLMLLILVGMGYLIVARTNSQRPYSPTVNHPTKRSESDEVLIKSINEVRKDLADLNAQISRRLTRIEQRVKTPDRTVKAPVRGSKIAVDSLHNRPTEKTPDAIAKKVVKQVEDKLTAKLERLASRRINRNREGQWKASVDDLAAELKLDDEAKEMAYGVFNGAHDEIFALFKKTRPDGTSMISDMLSDFREGTSNWEERLRTRLVSQKVPGADRTYMEALGTLYQRVSSDLGEHLSSQQMADLQDLNIALLEVKTGYDPIGDYIRSALVE